MTSPLRALALVLCIAVLASVGSSASYGYFSDSEAASGNLTAAKSFGGGGGTGSCGNPTTIGGSDAPNVDDLSATAAGSNNRHIQIDATFSDTNGDLNTVDIVVNTTTSPTVVYDNRNVPVSGGTDSVSDQTSKLKNKRTYCVRVTVMDNASNEDSAVTRQTTG